MACITEQRGVIVGLIWSLIHVNDRSDPETFGIGKFNCARLGIFVDVHNGPNRGCLIVQCDDVDYVSSVVRI